VSPRDSVAVLVAHPDDETLWAGGTLLLEANWAPFVTTLCRASDGPEQLPLPNDEVECALLGTLPRRRFARILTHSPLGEYTRHLRHEEVARAVLRLWLAGEISAAELWLFAYEDGGGRHLPTAIATADLVRELPLDIWQQKLSVLTDIYGFAPDSWEARATPRREAFFRVRTPADASAWLTPKYTP
jgi:LmbE family N-acetylglucosaminyl deacetylase